MRDGWTETTLGDVLEVRAERAGKDSDYAILSVTEKRGIIPQSEVFNRRIATEDISKYKVLLPGDIAFNPYLLWCGAVGQWMGGSPGVVSPVYECFRVRKSATPRFLGLIFESGVLTPYFDSTAIGSIVRRRRTTLPVFLAAQVTLPPMEEQRRIVDVVSSVDAYIDALKDKVVKARAARNAVLHELLNAGGPDWTETTLGDVVVLKPGRYIAKDSYVADGKYWIYGSNSVMGRYSDALVHEPHVVMAAIGAYAGAVRHSEDPSWVNNNAFALIPKSQLLSTWLFYWLESFLELSSVVVGTGQPYVQRPALMNKVFRLPPIGEQRRVVDVVSSMDDVIDASEKAVSEAVRLRSGLLSDLLSGEHEIPSSYDSLLGAA